MIGIVGEAIKLEIARRVKAAGVFAVLMDETTDVSHKEQVAVFVRFVNDVGQVCEHLIGVVDTAATTGEVLAGLLVDCVQSLDLSIENIVGQGYDGGSNMSGASKGVQARIKQLNPKAIFVHCYAHSLNRALVNAACDTTNGDVRNFFGLVELIFTFVEGSAARHAYFVEQQMKIEPCAVPLHLKGLSETRWNCRAAALRRLCKDHVFRAVLDTIEHVSVTTTDGTVRGTAAGLLNSINNFKFIACLQLLTPVMEAINNVSEVLQSPLIDILCAQSQVRALTCEMLRLRSDDSVIAALATAESVARQLGIDCELPVERQRKIPNRIDNNASTAAAALTPTEKLKVNFYFPVIDRFVREVKERFPMS